MTEEAKESRDVAAKKSSFSALGPVWILAIGTLLAGIAAAIGLLMSNSSDQRAINSTTSAPSMTLAPANVPPHVKLCSRQLLIGVDGDAGPTSCSDGELNELAWEYYTKDNLNVMALGSDALPDQVLRATCSDLKSGGSTIPIELSAYDISALYYGWLFGINPS